MFPSCLFQNYKYQIFLIFSGPLAFCKKAVERVNSEKNILNSSVGWSLWSGVDFFRKSHMYVHHQIGLNELINMMYFIYRGSINIKKKVLSNSFYIRAMSHWNRLPDECRKTEDHSTFKTKVLTYLWSLVENRLNMANCNLNISDREPD